MASESVSELQYRLRQVTLPIEKKGTSSPFDPEVLKYATSIDRRKCTRLVPMQVLVLGLSRTGTASMRHALFELGYFDVYHGSSLANENPRDCDIWTEALQGRHEGGRKFERDDWDQLLGHCMAVCDVPCHHFADDLIRAYPQAKVILTVRDSPEAWKKSMEKTIVASAVAFADQSLMTKLFGLFLPKSPYESMFALYRKHSGVLSIPQNGVEMYEAHNQWIRSLVSEENLLVMNVKEGWEPLCQFLEKDIPASPFPNINDGATYLAKTQAFNRKLGNQAFRNFAIFVSLVVLAVAGLMSFWRRRLD